MRSGRLERALQLIKALGDMQCVRGAHGRRVSRRLRRLARDRVRSRRQLRSVRTGRWGGAAGALRQVAAADGRGGGSRRCEGIGAGRGGESCSARLRLLRLPHALGSYWRAHRRPHSGCRPARPARWPEGAP